MRWFNDLYLFNITEEKWTQMLFKPLSSIPLPRSGFQMVAHATEDTIYVYGGFSKDKEPLSSSSSSTIATKKEGRVHADMWQLNLKQVLTTSGEQTSFMLLRLRFHIL